MFPINNERATKQKALDIRVILGNPPYSSGQESANDNNANLKYPTLDNSIAATYAARSTATLKNSLYDSYVRAIRWASDRLLAQPQGGVVAFVTNGGYIDSNTADGLRLTLADEFHHVYVYNLRGNQRTAGETSRKEGGKIFDAGSRATVAITILIKQPGLVPDGGAILHYRDIGDYLTRQQKLDQLADDLQGERPPALDAVGWTTIRANAAGDWINQRSESFSELTPLHSEQEPSIFRVRSNGLKTNRDAWNYNSSEAALSDNIARMIRHFNAQVDRFESEVADKRLSTSGSQGVESVIDLDPTKFSWDDGKLKQVARGKRLDPAAQVPRPSMYRPFHMRWAVVDREVNTRVGQLPRIFPSSTDSNSMIGVLSRGSSAPFSTLIVSTVPDDKLAGAGNPMQFIPQYLYNAGAPGAVAAGLFDEEPIGADRQHNVTDHALVLYQSLDPAIDKDDIFFYVYGILHSTDYRRAFAADLKKSLPRIPQVSTAGDFWAFSKAGRDLAQLHTEYESVDPWPELTYTYASGFDAGHADAYRVLKMKHPKILNPVDPDGGKVDDLSRIIYNDWITIEDIPKGAYSYELGSRSAIAWVIESNRVKTDKASGIGNDPNDWAIEHNDPTYILDLVGRIVTVSMRTLDIIDALPKLDV